MFVTYPKLRCSRWRSYKIDDPTSSKPRLRLAEDDGGKTASAVRRGIMAFAEGCFAAIRNPTSYDVQKELPEHEALEQLQRSARRLGGLTAAMCRR